MPLALKIKMTILGAALGAVILWAAIVAGDYTVKEKKARYKKLFNECMDGGNYTAFQCKVEVKKLQNY